MLTSGLKQYLCGVGTSRSPKDLQGSLSCSLDSRLPDLESPLPCSKDVIIEIGSLWTGREELPPNVLWRIVNLVGPKELKSLHRVNRAWRDAVCQGLDTVVVKKGNFHLLPRFPNVKSLGLQGAFLKQAETPMLESLQSIVLRDCSFEGSLASLVSLKDLQRMRLQDARSSSQEDCDELLEKLTKLTFLEWTRTPHSVASEATVPVHLPSYKNLSRLDSLQALLISDVIQPLQIQHMTQLSSLRQLRRLTISRGVMVEATAAAIAGLSDLHTLELVNCSHITSECLLCFSFLTGMTKLDLRQSGFLDESQLSDRGAQYLSSLVNLEYLNLAGHRSLTSSGVAFVSSLTKLSSLCLAGVGLWTEGAAFLGSLDSLQFLNVSRSLLTAEQLCALQPLIRLRHLNLSETYFNDLAAPAIAGMAQLETLRISYCPLGNEGFATITASCPKLGRVTVEGCWISTLCVLKTVVRHPRIKLWRHDQSWLPRWMRKLDVVLIAQTQPYSRKLRALYQAEDSWGATLAVGVAVIIFATVYTGILLMLFTAVFLLPMFFLGILSLGVMIVAFATKGLSGSSVRGPTLLHQLEAILFSSHEADQTQAQERLEEML